MFDRKSLECENDFRKNVCTLLEPFSAYIERVLDRFCNVVYLDAPIIGSNRMQCFMYLPEFKQGKLIDEAITALMNQISDFRSLFFLINRCYSQVKSPSTTIKGVSPIVRARKSC